MTSIEQPSSRPNFLSVKDMNPMARGFDCEVIVLQKEGDASRTREGDLISRFLVADKTASIVLSVWGEIGMDVRGGDILRISGVDSKLRKGQLFISTPKFCKLRRVGQDTFPFVEKPNMSEVEFPQSMHNIQSSRPRNQQLQQQQPQQQQQQQSNRIPNTNISSNRPHRGYQNNNNTNSNSNTHPYNNNRNRPNQRGQTRGRGGGMGNNGRYHQDLDNPVS